MNTLPKKIKDYYDSKATEFDIQTSTFIKYLLIKNIEDKIITTYQASRYAERYIADGLQEYGTRELKKFTSHKDFISFVIQSRNSLK
ncbi:MAG: hypothetical protein ACYDAS_00680 [Patescibacteria group bacterium]